MPADKDLAKIFCTIMINALFQKHLALTIDTVDKASFYNIIESTRIPGGFYAIIRPT